MDYYSSTKDALCIFNDSEAEKYLPTVIIYLDDISLPEHNEFAGALLAVNEFNISMDFRKICVPHFLEKQRIFKNPIWIKQIRYAHIMDHPGRFKANETEKIQIITNPYLK